MTAGCFWYLSRQIDLTQVIGAIPRLNFRWAGLALAIGFIQIPIVALRWHEIAGGYVREVRLIPQVHKLLNVL